MATIKFKIDEKSLFYGMYNDYIRGQTATVSTPLNQSNNPQKWHNDILKLCETDLYLKNVPDMLVKKCLSKTTSQAEAKVVYIFVFKKILLDGKPLDCECSFAIYIKEEISEYIKRKSDGKIGKNTHFGRKKLHYPQTLKHTQDGLNIDNQKVLDSILEQNGGFAFIVRGFECNIEDRSINFITSLVGLKGIYLSSVFKKQKGVGKKLLLQEIIIDTSDLSDKEITYLINTNNANTNSTSNIFEEINKVKAENGRLGEEAVLIYLQEHVKGITDIYHTSKDYPTSPYDIEFIQDGVKKYIEVKATSGVKKVFNMSSGEIKFMSKYKEDYKLFLVTSVKDDFPNITEYLPEDIIHLKKEYPTTRFYA